MDSAPPANGVGEPAVDDEPEASGGGASLRPTQCRGGGGGGAREAETILLDAPAREAWVAVPILHNGGFRGVIAVRKAAGEALTDAETRLVGDLAAQAGLVLELRATA
ncbi:hypothetical protein AB0M20_17745, partial [Actinoplanes sp. NPDC051633]|uniref:hypothetical protein n=1 Tax=Actinoplanes sp. NPDC051633 TaxID=3155670 RepID=UPI003432B1AC